MEFQEIKMKTTLKTLCTLIAQITSSNAILSALS